MTWQFILEVEGVIHDVADAHYKAHLRAAEDVGWSRLDRDTFWRLTRTKGQQAVMLPGARPIKQKNYDQRFAACVDAEDSIMSYAPHAGVDDTLRRIARHGPCLWVSLCANREALRALIGRPDFRRHVPTGAVLDPNPRLRTAELLGLAGGASSRGRTVVVGASDALLRIASSAELLPVGVASGGCSVARLKQTGAEPVFRALADLADELDAGAPQLQRMGLLPYQSG